MRNCHIWSVFQNFIQIHFGSGAAWIRNDFFRIRILPKVSDPTGSGSTKLCFYQCCRYETIYSGAVSYFSLMHTGKPVLWIRIDFNEDPDPVFFTAMGSGSRSQTNKDRDPDPGQTLPSPEVEFLHKNILFLGNRVTKFTVPTLRR